MIKLDNSFYQSLNDNFYRLQQPDPIEEPELILFNQKLSEYLNLSTQDKTQDQLAMYFSGTHLPDELIPIALAYAGHQFGNFVPQLGDGRAVLLGETVATDNIRYDIQLKGSGITPFSRSGDGKSALGPVIREYIVSEAMYNLGVPTTRALAAVVTGETVYRQVPEPGGIFTRVAKAHIRIGSFEYFAARNKFDEVKQLADYAISRLYPEVLDTKNPYLSFFKAVAERLLSLIAKWQGLGFIHGVMNTDNMSIAGETIDYGPCAFMDEYKADKVFSSIDRYGRYAFNQQPSILQWNLSLLASCLVPLVDEDQQESIKQLNAVMEQLPEIFEDAWLNVFRKKLGLSTKEQGDRKLIENLLTEFEINKTDFTIGFRELNQMKHPALKQRLASEPLSTEESIQMMNAHNPWIIPRNHQVARAIDAAYQGNYDYFKKLVAAYNNPFVDQAQYSELYNPPTNREVVTETFCGT